MKITQKVLLFLLLAFPLVTFAQDEYSLSVFQKFTGEAVNDTAGKSVSFAGDVNGDGYDDLLIGADGYNNGLDTDVGAAYLIYGQSDNLASASLSLSTIVKFTGEADDDYAGFYVSSAGDVDNDGYDDFLIGAYGANSSAGAAYLIYGQSALLTDASLSTAVKFTGEAADDNAGDSVFSAGDVDNDGYDDFLVGATGENTSAGAAYLIYGQSDNLTSKALSDASIIKFTGEAISDYAGSVSSAGDVDNDGYDDFLVGARGVNSSAGAAYLVYGQAVNLSNASLSTAVKFTGEAAGDWAGRSVSSAGDVDNDGYDDFLVGANGENALAGAAYLVYGQSDNLTSKALSDASIIKFTGEAANDYAGQSFSSAGDVNNDGYSDILVDASANDFGGSNAGAAYLGYLYIDSDLDGTAGTDGLFSGTDCNDDDATVSANQTYYVDSDLDGYGSITTASVCSATAPSGYSVNSTDCSDTDNTVNANQTYYQDLDGDGLGNALVTASVCSLTPPTGYVTNSTDTNDTIKDISTIIAGGNGDITITYVNNETSTIDVFNYTGTDNIILQQYQDNYYLALHPKAKSLALIDINALSVLSKKTLSKKSFPTNSLKTFILRNKNWAVITAKNKNNKVKLSLVAIKINEETLGKKAQASLINKKIKPAKTKKNKNTILLRSKNNNIIAKYLLTKKYILKAL